MYQRGEVVLYSAHGVCRITDIVRKTMAGETAEYYVLQPIYEEGSTLFLPTGNEKLTAKMRRIPPAGGASDPDPRAARPAIPVAGGGKRPQGHFPGTSSRGANAPS